ncbi:hypothetical protein [Pseudomonas lopnurensis]|uniref:hypothetical protein n=1 Tax=Pseudomonas lopnurensis TaxID=1477517 RepID=UPI001879A68D|nr:hypothetical protein [Pseudomonas lopnurensis]MBE7376573.1 hypothetical protein [Pseudomonas lopnurensis]
MQANRRKFGNSLLLLIFSSTSPIRGAARSRQLSYLPQAGEGHGKLPGYGTESFVGLLPLALTEACFCCVYHCLNNALCSYEVFKKQ